MDGDRMAFGRRGEVAEGPPHPYGEAYATLAIFCRTDSLPAMAAVVLEEGPFVRNIEGEARVAAQAADPEVAGPYGPTHVIRWISRPPGPTIAVLADPDLRDMWAELRSGHHLMAVVPTSGGTHHYRFDLDGFTSQEERCQNASGHPPTENPLGGTRRAQALLRGRVVRSDPRHRKGVGFRCFQRDQRGGAHFFGDSGRSVMIRESGVRSGTMAPPSRPVAPTRWTG